MVEVAGLTYQVGGFTIVDGVSFAIQPGEFVSVIGPNGAGKTSLLNLLSGIHRPTAGSIRLLGRDVTSQRPHERARAGLGRTFQTSTVFNALPVLENVRLGVQARSGGSLEIWRRAGADRDTLEAARQALKAAGLEPTVETAAGLLPHGTKRRLELAILLGGGFAVLLLDEPTAGLSVEHVPEMVEVIRHLHKQEGKTVLMVEHRMDLVVGLSDRIAVMHQGRLLALDTPPRVMADPRVQEAYLGPLSVESA
ncbi:MAG TPA: ABC transporter ATP-binding protein [Candidatus Dormibacteraeota bacterium]